MEKYSICNVSNGIAIPKYLPGCYCRDGKARNLETGGILEKDPALLAPVFVRIRGKKREAKRLIWLWRIVAKIQVELEGKHI